MGKHKYKLNEKLEIEWDDAATITGWHKPNNKLLRKNNGLSRCKTTGHFLRENNRAIQMSHCIADDGDRLDTQVIPKSCIRKVHKLRNR